MIEQLPDGDAHAAYDVPTCDDPRRRHRRTTWLAVAVLVIAAAATALTQQGNDRTPPVAAPPSSRTIVGPTGALILVGADGSRRLMPDAGLTQPITMSPNGTKVAYVGDGAGGSYPGLWIADADGSNARQVPLCRRCVPGWGLDWSHDATRLAFVTSRPGEPTWQIRVRTLATGAELELEKRGVLSDVSFSPDDGHLAVVVGTRSPVIATAEVGAGLSPLHVVSPPHRAIRTPAWSPDGTTIYYTASDARPYRRRDGDSPLDVLRVSDLYALDVRTGRERQITHAANGERYYTVHVDGGRLLTIHAIRGGDTAIGWLSPDGSSFEPVVDAHGQLVNGSSEAPRP